MKRKKYSSYGEEEIENDFSDEEIKNIVPKKVSISTYLFKLQLY